MATEKQGGKEKTEKVEAKPTNGRRRMTTEERIKRAEEALAKVKADAEAKQAKVGEKLKADREKLTAQVNERLLKIDEINDQLFELGVESPVDETAPVTES